MTEHILCTCSDHAPNLANSCALIGAGPPARKPLEIVFPTVDTHRHRREQRTPIAFLEAASPTDRQEDTTLLLASLGIVFGS